MSNIVQFEELERARREDSDEVVVYDGRAFGTTFAYLYLNSTTYTFVWLGPPDLEFDAEQSYAFIKQQFSYSTQAEIDLFEVILPDRRPSSKAIARRQHFYYNRAIATLILSDTTDKSVAEYDLLDNDKHRVEYVENIRRPEYRSRIAFSRYDSEVIKIRGEEEIPVACCFTIERPYGTTQSMWEFTICLPRDNTIRRRTLAWITKTHHAARLMHKLDFKGTRDALHELLNPQTESVFSEEIS